MRLGRGCRQVSCQAEAPTLGSPRDALQSRARPVPHLLSQAVVLTSFLPTEPPAAVKLVSLFADPQMTLSHAPIDCFLCPRSAADPRAPPCPPSTARQCGVVVHDFTKTLMKLLAGCVTLDKRCHRSLPVLLQQSQGQSKSPPHWLRGIRPRGEALGLMMDADRTWCPAGRSYPVKPASRSYGG